LADQPVRFGARRAAVAATLILLSQVPVAVSVQTTVAVRVEVRSEDQPLAGAVVTLGSVSAQTGGDGVATLTVPPGPTRLTVRHGGFLPLEQDVTATTDAPIVVDLVEAPEVEEEVIVVASTRTGRRLEDQPTRVEVLDREAIEEKMLMTPGDIVMMLNEMGGLRVQSTSPSIGAASVRVQGMQGRYTRFLSDGLPLYGQQVGGLGLLQIPPMDLGQVEVIKGAASAFYGAGAMGGVVNLLSRRPGPEPAYDVLLNQTTLGGTDLVGFLSAPITGRWRWSLLGGGHRQSRADRDDDGWADVAGYTRGVVRPRLFFDGGDGRVGFATVGLTAEERTGGTMSGARLAATGAAYAEALDTTRVDAGGSWQMLLRERFVFTARGAAAWQRHDHRFGAVRERDTHHTGFGEAALRGSAGRHTWVAGLALERDRFMPRDVPRFAYTYLVPGVFAQDDIEVASWLALSAGARVDHHDEYGTFVSPRLAALVRRHGWTSRVSVGRGFFASTPLTEETEAAGLSRLAVPAPLSAERATTVSVDVTRALGPATVTATMFGSRIADPVGVDRDGRFELATRDAATTNLGLELLGTARRGPAVVTGSYTYVRAREGDRGQRREVPLTPGHTAGVVGMWEVEDTGRIGLELYYTGRQRLEENPYRARSRPYVVVGLLAEKRVGRVRLFVNAENVTDVRQTRWDSLLRPSPGADGRWTVDAWAPLDGRVVNGGVRLDF
jgi:outer membrane receptor for ferrienterochelin and colicins